MQGIRFYIGLVIGLISLEALWWEKAMFRGTVLGTIRLAEVYAWLAVSFLFLALLIGPLYKMGINLPGKRIAFEARRLLGIGAARFASLHTAVAYASLFKGFRNPFFLPATYEKSFLLGLIGLLILLALAFTSFDRAMKSLGIWWYRLHRLVYVAGVLTILHAFMIGTHATRRSGLLALTVMALVIVGLQAYVAMYQRQKAWWRLALGVGVICLTLTLRYGVTQYRSINYIENQPPGGPLP